MQRLVSIDSLRGLAAVAVVLCHAITITRSSRQLRSRSWSSMMC